MSLRGVSSGMADPIAGIIEDPSLVEEWSQKCKA